MEFNVLQQNVGTADDDAYGKLRFTVMETSGVRDVHTSAGFFDSGRLVLEI